MKIIKNILTVFLLAVIFVPTNLGAFTLIEQNLDVYSVGGSGGNGISGHQYTGQSFKPTRNILNKVSVNLKGAGDNVFAQLTKTGDSGLLLSGTPFVHTTVDGNYKWYDITFSDVSVTPGQSYTLWIGTYGGSFWSMNAEPDAYANGMAYIDCATWVSNASCDHWLATADWDFKVYGYTPAAPVPPSQPVTPAANSPLSSAGATTKKSTATTTTVATLEPPVLTSLQKNKTNVKLPVVGSVKVTQNGKLTLAGTSTAGAEVGIIFNKKTYPAVTEKDGKWKLDLVFTGVAEGKYEIKAKTTKDNKSSAEASFFNAEVAKADKAKAATLIKSWYSNWTIFHTLVAVGLLLLVLLFLSLVAKRHYDQIKKSETPVEPETEEKSKPVKNKK